MDAQTPAPQKEILLRLNEEEANQLAFLMDTALKSPVGGLRVMKLVGHFMAKLSEGASSGLVIAAASDLPKPPRV